MPLSPLHGKTRGPGSQISYEVLGQGSPLILIAGFAASRAIWEPQLDDWVGQHTLVLLDNRKVGRSRDGGGIPWIPLMAQDVLAVMDDLGLARATLCGMSMGGFIALTIAVRWPERVDRLILTCTAPQRPVPRPGIGPGLVFFSDDFARQHRETVRYWVQKGRAARWPAAMQQLLAIIAFDMRSDVPRISAPALVVHGTSDRVIPIHHGRWLASHIPGASLVVFQGAGHGVTIERAADYNREVLAWLAGTEPAGPA